MELQVGVKVLLKNPDGKFLLIRRSIDKYQEVQHKWDIPGGRIDSGSDLRENLSREVMEETELTMTSEPRVVGAQDIFNKEQDRHIVRVTYVGTAEGTPKLSDEHTDFKWVSYEELLILPNLDKYLKALLETGVISSTSV